MLHAMADERSPAREAAARAAVELVAPDTTIGLGSGRALWRVAELIGERWSGEPPVRAVVASEHTRTVAEGAGIEVVELDGHLRPSLALDGADEIDPRLRLVKGGGGALLREKIVAAAAERFVVVAETSKQVERLGESFALPVEVVRFGWADTARRIEALLPGGVLRRREDGEPYVTDEGHLLLDCPIPADADLDALGGAIHDVPGVVEHGLFADITERVLLGDENGELVVHTRP
jgi:ribose 5-phosphate isomerase A